MCLSGFDGFFCRALADNLVGHCLTRPVSGHRGLGFKESEAQGSGVQGLLVRRNQIGKFERGRVVFAVEGFNQ